MDVTIDLRARLNKHPRVVFRALGDGQGGVLLHLITGQYYGLNVTGSLVWNLLDGARTLEEIVAQVRAQVTDAPADLAQDVIEFIRHLQERQLVETVVTDAQTTVQPSVPETMSP